MNSDQIATVKGLLYESVNKQNKKIKETLLPHTAKTIVWLEKAHKEKKVYQLKSLKKDERAALVNTAINIIIDIVSGKTQISNNKLYHWTVLGFKVVAEYEEEIINSKKMIKYKLELKKEEKTKGEEKK